MLTNRADLLNYEPIVDRIQNACSRGELDDEGASREYKRLRALRNFAYKLRSEAAHCIGQRILLQHARENSIFDMEDTVFVGYVAQAREEGYLRILTDVSSDLLEDQIWLFA
jgi:hypothetical protein